jgi:hypothetical protein
MVGQPAAAVTVLAGVGVGEGVGAGAGLLIVTLPLLPGDAISLGPQPARASVLQPNASGHNFFVTVFPLNRLLIRQIVAASVGPIEADRDSLAAERRQWLSQFNERDR